MRYLKRLHAKFGGVCANNEGGGGVKYTEFGLSQINI
jgi:hypothetical protein